MKSMNKKIPNNIIIDVDGIYDTFLLKKCKIGLCPADARIEAKKTAIKC